MRTEGKIAIVVVCLLVIVVAVYFFRTSNEKPIDLTGGQKKHSGQMRKVNKQEIPLPVNLTSPAVKPKQNEAKPVVDVKSGEEKPASVAQSQPAISTIKITPESAKSEISISLNLEPQTTAPANVSSAAERSGLASRPAEVIANKPVAIKLNLPKKKKKSKTRQKELTEKEVYIVGPGDTLYDIAKKYYGKGELWTVIARENPSVNPDKLLVGQKIVIPPKMQAIWKFEAGESKLPAEVDKAKLKPYTVKSGESFYTIARDVLGDASRWREIFDINKAAVKGDPKRLRAGQIIFIPRK